jgi:hypothetical protein
MRDGKTRGQGAEGIQHAQVLKQTDMAHVPQLEQVGAPRSIASQLNQVERVTKVVVRQLNFSTR